MEQVSIGHQNWGEFYRLFAAKFLPWLVFWFVLKVVFSIGCVEGGFCSDFVNKSCFIVKVVSRICPLNLMMKLCNFR